MPNSSTQRPLLPLAACMAAALLTTVVSVVPLSAAPKKAAAKAGQIQKQNSQLLNGSDDVTPEGEVAETKGESDRIRLNYIKASWKRVLEDVAKAMDKELVIDQVPSTRYSRLDRTQHAPDEALRILNRDLAGFGQKLVVKGDYLVMISVRQSRTDYPPAVIQSDRAETARRMRLEEESPENEQVVARRRPAPPQAVWPPEEAELPPARLPARSRSGVRRAAVDEFDEPEPRAVRRVSRVYDEELADDAVEQTEVRMSNRDCRSVAKIVYKAFKGNVEKLTRGPAGLEGFSVFSPADETGGRRRLRFRVGIDEERNSLVIEATPRETESARKLIRALDKLPPGVDGAVKAVSSKHADAPFARSLQKGIDNLALAGRMQQVDARDDAGDELGDEDDQPAPVPRRRGETGSDGRGSRSVGPGAVIGGAPGMPLPQALQGSLKGEVSIEAVPDLNLFIIRGNERDVETVMEILKEIEKLSEASAPQVRVEVIEHLNSEALATLLTSVYDRISPTRRGTGGAQAQSSSALILPIARPNAILIVAPQADLESILRLVDELDQPSDPKMEYRVIRLKHAVPLQVAEQIRELYPVGQTTTGQPGGAAPGGAAGSTGIALSPRVTIVPDSRTNAVIVQARPRDMAEVVALI
ncbi:MAG: hypothetical protein EHM42_06500, partial [Planctomycetaceae bacterium]